MLMALFHGTIKKDSISLRFSFHSHVHIFSNEILPVCRLKYSYSCSSYFCLLVSVIFLSVPMLPMLLLAAIISLSLLFLM